MVTKLDVVENVKKYILERKRNYSHVNTEKILYDENVLIPYGKHEGKRLNVFTVICEIEGYYDSINHFIATDAETGEILYTVTPHGYAEERD